MEPPHTYLREPSAVVVHHADYLNAADDHALCGVALTNPAAVGQPDTPEGVCPGCESQLIVYHLRWWREKALAATAELDELRTKYGVQPQPADSEPAIATADDAEATGFLGQARRDLVELCRQFEGAVPFYRLKNSMQDFSDRLSDDERSLLAQEIGSDSSLIRWATTEVESLGLTVTNNRVQENTDMQWEEWLQESQPAPKAKRRFGRSR